MWSPEELAALYADEPAVSHGSAARYDQRLARWREEVRLLPEARHTAWWWLHNLVAHPLIGLFPQSAKAVWLHDWSSDGLNRQPGSKASPLPAIGDLKMWRYHNLIAHPLIGLVPDELFFDLHDDTARQMRTPGWV